MSLLNWLFPKKKKIVTGSEMLRASRTFNPPPKGRSLAAEDHFEEYRRRQQREESADTSFMYGATLGDYTNNVPDPSPPSNDYGGGDFGGSGSGSSWDSSSSSD